MNQSRIADIDRYDTGLQVANVTLIQSSPASRRFNPPSPQECLTRGKLVLEIQTFKKHACKPVFSFLSQNSKSSETKRRGVLSSG